MTKKLGFILIVLALSLSTLPFIFLLDLAPAAMVATPSSAEVPYGSEIVIKYKWTTPARTDIYHNRQYAVTMQGAECANNKYGATRTYWREPWEWRSPNEIVEGSFLVQVTCQTDTNVWRTDDGWSTKESIYRVYVNQLFNDGGIADLWFDKTEVKVKLFVGEPTKPNYDLVVYILDENSKGLPGVTVTLDNGDKVITNSLGVAIFSINGRYEIIGTKSGYENVEKTISVTDSDVEVALTMNEIVVPTPSPTETPSPTVTPGDTETPIPTVTPGPTIAITPTPLVTELPTSLPDSNEVYVYFAFFDETGETVDGVTLNVINEEYISDSGVVSFTVPKGTSFQAVGIKEGYNRFSSSYTADTDLNIRVNLAESGGSYFVDVGDIKDMNPLTDAFGVGGAIPMEIAIVAGISLLSGIFLLLRNR
ncbi:MAG: hypothetical protein KAS66_08960 [Candidatus Omnitrophica bacterium]|nr:hypothetical protein [Candidatus Omnitrophota bacterium]